MRGLLILHCKVCARILIQVGRWAGWAVALQSSTTAPCAGAAGNAPLWQGWLLQVGGCGQDSSVAFEQPAATPPTV